jgi:hypothetical protein
VAAKIATALIVLGLLVLWQAGTFDRPLSEVGLNAQDCVVNGMGGKFCGDAAVTYCLQVRSIAPTSDCERIIAETTHEAAPLQPTAETLPDPACDPLAGPGENPAHCD